MTNRTLICGCAVCPKQLFEGDKLAQHVVRDCEGDLDYIELAHEACATRDNAERGRTYWEV